jgi:hypothetical protein
VPGVARRSKPIHELRSFSGGSLGTWIGRGFLLSLGYVLLKFIAVGLELVATAIWDSTQDASPGTRRFVRGGLIVVGVLAAIMS